MEGSDQVRIIFAAHNFIVMHEREKLIINTGREVRKWITPET